MACRAHNSLLRIVWSQCNLPSRTLSELTRLHGTSSLAGAPEPSADRSPRPRFASSPDGSRDWLRERRGCARPDQAPNRALNLLPYARNLARFQRKLEAVIPEVHQGGIVASPRIQKLSTIANAGFIAGDRLITSAGADLRLSWPYEGAPAPGRRDPAQRTPRRAPGSGRRQHSSAV